MSAILTFLGQHQILATALCTWAANSGFTIFATSLPAPTAQSSNSYQFWFKFLNRLAANLARANNTSVESSPNFQGALNRQTDLAGMPQIVAVQPPKGSPDVPAPAPKP